jgi:magnesium chelatase subunit D
MTDPAAEPSAWDDAVLAAELFALAPAMTGGVLVRSQAGPARDRWLERMRVALPCCAPVRRLPVGVTDDRLLGGLDLAATLRAGRPIAERGILAACDGGAVILSMAERIEAASAARIAAALDCGEVDVHRDGIVDRHPAGIGVVALDEGVDSEERPPAVLADRLAFWIDIGAVAIGEIGSHHAEPERLAAARTRLSGVSCEDRVREALCGAAMAFGIGSMRAPLLALRVARAHAALAARDHVIEADALVATRLVLAPRATRLPASPQAGSLGEDEERDDADIGEAPAEADAATTSVEHLSEALVEAVRARLPAGLLDALSGTAARSARAEAARGAAPVCIWLRP